MDLLTMQMEFLRVEAPLMLKHLSQAATARHFETIAITAHRLAGLLGTFDDRLVLELARRIENQAQANSTSGLNALISQVAERLENLLVACQES